ncbi:hypothetical protein ACVRW7_09430 [Streptococcus ratti]
MKIKIRLGDADADRAVIKSRQQGLNLIFEEYDFSSCLVPLRQLGLSSVWNS